MDLNKDSLSVDTRKDYLKNEILTKREMLSLTHRIFDPIGYTSVPLRLEIMLQKCQKLKVTWNSKLPIKIRKNFEKWKNQLNDLENIVIPSCILNDPENS